MWNEILLFAAETSCWFAVGANVDLTVPNFNNRLFAKMHYITRDIDIDIDKSICWNDQTF